MNIVHGAFFVARFKGSKMQLISRYRGALLGLACGDAVGTTVEFRSPGSFTPLTDMVGGGPFGLKVGQWTDDTSMALCLATSLIERGCFDPKDQMERYSKWYHNGYLSSTGTCFDIGMTVNGALARFDRTGEPFSGSTDPRSAGNGSIMRLAPTPMFYFPDAAAAIHWSAESSRTTHGADDCIESCQLLAAMVCNAFKGLSKSDVLFGFYSNSFKSPKVTEIANGHYRDKTELEIVGSGYVIKSLEAAVWCFWKTGSFEEAILKAANLGDDADTTAAICGQIAGAYYGEEGIPVGWLSKLHMCDEIRHLADQLHDATPPKSELS